ncbi:Protein FAR1-RELATED SEQUENCE 5 [Hordeum vulgare]|nr:Protein FAR1-RELATED SEQUENCE 5 [Hordeum vulgare]
MVVADPNSGGKSFGGIPPEVAGGDDHNLAEVDNWLDNMSFAAQEPSQPEFEHSQKLASDEVKGIEGLEKICSKYDVHQTLIYSHTEKILNIRVMRADEPCNADENKDSYFAEHCINTQQSCTKVVDISIDRKEELKNNIIQIKADLNHFEGDNDVSEFLSDDGTQIKVATMWNYRRLFL